MEDVRDYNREAFNLVRLQNEISDSITNYVEMIPNIQMRSASGERDTDTEDDGNVRSGISSDSEGGQCEE